MAERSYYAIIPANIRYDQTLPANAKLLYGEITALCNEKGFCWAGNNYFAELYRVSDKTVQRWISQLVEAGYINRNIQYKEDNKTVLNRCLSIISNVPTSVQNCGEGGDKNVPTPGDENAVYNNKDINNTSNNTNKERKERLSYDKILNEVSDENVRNVLKEFIKMRTLIKKPLTDYALKNLISRLYKLSPISEVQVGILEQSILNNWQNIYPINDKNINKDTTNMFRALISDGG